MRSPSRITPASRSFLTPASVVADAGSHPPEQVIVSFDDAYNIVDVLPLVFRSSAGF